MRIAIISPGPFSVPPIRGSSVEHDIEEVSKQLAKKHKVIIFTRICKEYSRSEKKGRVSYIRLKYQGQNDYIKKVCLLLPKQKPDLILIENRPSFFAPVKKSVKNTPIVVNMHSHVFASSRNISKKHMQRVVRQSAGFITNSSFLRRHYVKKHQIPEKKVHAIHLGVDASDYERTDKMKERVHAVKMEWGIKADDRIMMYAGRLMKEKGVHLLIKAFLQILQNDTTAKLLILGGRGYGTGAKKSSPYIRKLKKLAKPAGDRIQFMGFIPSPEMPVWYQLADVIATPSLWNEPFCRVNLEGMAAGKPVLTTTRGGIGEVVQHENGGYVIPPKSWIKRVPLVWEELFRNPETYRSMSDKAWERAKELSWKKTGQQYEKVFEEAIGKKGSA
ncbi:glycosyltransferase family 4 protein [Brevibacillus daliensis]|uniref:glycosyltransferase family 4 protein n=1 Tax=Brevibacillus daliensis TaxID=2892995 RepID=UPI001E5D281A|nr:glycosyltransferase family 4 protein [Brevibacillus daliensis]